MLNRTANDVAFCHGDDVRNAITTVDHCTGECAICHLVARPASCQSKHSLHGNVQPFDIERFKHDLGRSLTIFRRVERWLSQHKVVFFRLRTQVLENTLLPKALHQVPIFHHSMTDRLVHLVRFGIRIRLVTNKKV